MEDNDTDHDDARGGASRHDEASEPPSGLPGRQALLKTAAATAGVGALSATAAASHCSQHDVRSAADVGSPAIDDFERSDPFEQYGGAADQFAVETSTVYEGGQALVNDSGGFYSAVSQYGLDRYPTRGDEFTVHFNNAADDNFVGVHFFAQSETDQPDSYVAGISGQGAWRLWAIGSGGQIASQDLPASDQISGWYRAEISTDETTVYADLYDDASDTLLASVQADDESYSVGGIGFRSAGNGEVFDYAFRSDVNEAPSCSIVSPSDGATVDGTTTVQVDASDAEDGDDSLDVDVAIDGGSWRSAAYDSSTGYYEYDWDTTAESDGDHDVDARATDSNGQTTSVGPVSVTVDNVDDPTPTPTIEDFERSNPLAEYGGNDQAFAVTTSTTYEGGQALIQDSGDFNGAMSLSGLERYPKRGDDVTVYFNNASDDNYMAFHFFAQAEEDNPDGYAVGISGQSAFKLWSNGDDDGPLIAEDDLPTSDQISGWYRVEISTDSTTVSADLYDDGADELLASVSADNITWSEGGVGFRSTGNGEVFDYAVQAPIDDFERSSPLDEYGGAADQFGVETSTVYEGSRALVNDSGGFYSAVSTSGLGAYPERGDEFTVYFNNAGDDNFVSTHFFAQSESDQADGYQAGISGAGAWKLWSIGDENTDSAEIASADLPSSEQIDGWYRAEISTDSTTVYADLYDDSSDELLASVSADNTTWSVGGIGFRSAGNGEVWDYVYR